MSNHPKFTEPHDSAERPVGYEGARESRLTAEIFNTYRARVSAANPERLHEWEQDITRNRHSAGCWCVGEATKLAEKEGYL